MKVLKLTTALLLLMIMSCGDDSTGPDPVPVPLNQTLLKMAPPPDEINEIVISVWMNDSIIYDEEYVYVRSNTPDLTEITYHIELEEGNEYTFLLASNDDKKETAWVDDKFNGSELTHWDNYFRGYKKVNYVNQPSFDIEMVRQNNELAFVSLDNTSSEATITSVTVDLDYTAFLYNPFLDSTLVTDVTFGESKSLVLENVDRFRRSNSIHMGKGVFAISYKIIWEDIDGVEQAPVIYDFFTEEKSLEIDTYGARHITELSIEDDFPAILNITFITEYNDVITYRQETAIRR